MSGGSALRVLARALRGGGGDRRRSAWVMAATAGASALGCSAIAVASLWITDAAAQCDPYTSEVDGVVTTGLSCWTRPAGGGLAPYLADPALRGGVVAAVCCLMLPFVLLTAQSLRFGTAARERRLAGLVAAGAGRAELRRLGAIEAVRPAAIGAVAGVVGYLVLWLLLGVAAPLGWRFLPSTPWWGLAGGPVVAVLMVVVAAMVGMRAARPASLTPTGLARRGPRPLTRREAAAPALFGAGFVAAAIAVLRFDSSVTTWPLLACLVGAAVTAGPPLAALAGAFLVRRGAPVSVLAGRRLLGEPRTPGRVAGVLVAVGVALGLEAQYFLMFTVPMGEGSVADDPSGQPFFLVGLAIATGATLVAAAVGFGSLAAGAAEHVLDTARPTAALAALGASGTELTAVLRLWLRAAALAPALVGGLIGSILGALINTQVAMPVAWLAVGVVLALVAVFAVGALGSLVAGRLLRPALIASAAAENLRTA